MDDERVIVPYDEAIRRIGSQDQIHTFRQTGPILIGAHWDRDSLLAAFRKYGVEESGPEAIRTLHGLVFIDEHGPVFVETVSTDVAAPTND